MPTQFCVISAPLMFLGCNLFRVICVHYDWMEEIRFLDKTGMIIICVASDVQRERRGESRTAKGMKTL